MAMQDSFDEAKRYAISELLAVIVNGEYPDGTPRPGGRYLEVDTYGDLPSAALYTGAIYVVRQSTGIWLINRKSAGLYRSDGATWVWLGELIEAFDDANFEIYNSIDDSKKAVWDVSGISTATERTITMPDADVNLGNIDTDVIDVHTQYAVISPATQARNTIQATANVTPLTLRRNVAQTEALLDIVDSSDGFLASWNADGGITVGVADTRGADINFYSSVTSLGGGRVFWNESKAAFFAGIDPGGGQTWSDSTVGIASVGLGYNVNATADYTVAISNADATAQFATSIGWGSIASGTSSVSLGTQARSGIQNSVAVGFNAWTTGVVSNNLSIGTYVNNSGDKSVLIGTGIQSPATYLTNTRSNAVVFGANAVTGFVLTSTYVEVRVPFVPENKSSQAIIARGLDAQEENIFEVQDYLENVFVSVSEDGLVGIGTETPSEKLDVNGRIIEDGTFAEIYTNDNSTATSVAAGTTYTLFNQWQSNGQSANATPDQANNKITLTKTGRYMVTVSMSLKSGTANIVLAGAAFLGGTEQNQIHFQRKLSTAGDIGSTSACGFIDVTTENTDLDFRFRHDNISSVNITVSYANMNIIYLGET